MLVQFSDAHMYNFQYRSEDITFSSQDLEYTSINFVAFNIQPKFH
jgi:hypothetical protein